VPGNNNNNNNRKEENPIIVIENESGPDTEKSIFIILFFKACNKNSKFCERKKQNCYLTHFFLKKNNRVQLQENKKDQTSVTLGIF
jgi:hypothetical protein